MEEYSRLVGPARAITRERGRDHRTIKNDSSSTRESP